MIDSLRKAALQTDFSIEALLAAGVLVSFASLLVQNSIHPIVIYVLQLYLSF